MRRSTVLGLPPQLVFLGTTVEKHLSVNTTQGGDTNPGLKRERSLILTKVTININKTDLLIPGIGAATWPVTSALIAYWHGQPALVWSSSYVASHHLAVVSQSGTKDQFYCSLD